MIKGIKKVSGETKLLKGLYDSIYLELFYDKEKNECWTIIQNDFGHSWYTEYRNKNIVKICNICRPKTMKEIEKLITAVVSDLEYHDFFNLKNVCR